MSTLQLITKASSPSNNLTPDSQYPIVLNPDSILLNLKPQDASSFIKRVEGWSISQTDTDVIESGQKFFKTLKIKLKNPNSFSKDEFITLFTSYLEKNGEIVGNPIVVEPNHENYTNSLIQNLGFLIGDAVLGLVLEACFAFEIWEILEALIVYGLVEGSGSGSGSNDLIRNLIEKRRSDLVCLCVRHVSNLEASDMLLVLKFFLSPPRDAYSTMARVRKEWENRAVSAMETAKKSNLAGKDAAILLMMADDEFTTNELCLHHLLASPNLDDVVLSACIAGLSGVEIMGLVRYLKKWLIKYQKFPQACVASCSAIGLKASVPSLEDVTKCFGLVVDEHFSSLVMHPEFREEVESIELVVNSLAAEARICCNLVNLLKD